jgi:hypothetical protein
MAETKPYRPSNGTEGECFYGAWCAKCSREAHGNHCGIFGRSLMFQVGDPQYPREWVRDADAYPGNPRCTAFTKIRDKARPSRVKDKRQETIQL